VEFNHEVYTSEPQNEKRDKQPDSVDELPAGFTLDPIPDDSIPIEEFIHDTDDLKSPAVLSKMKLRCDRGREEPSCNTLGNIDQELGKVTEAKLAYSKGCKINNAAACDNLGMLELNHGNKKEGLRLITKACDEHYMDACAHLGMSEKVDGNITKSKKYVKIACDGGSMLGCFILAVIEAEKGNLD
jgi:hypothetical protein